MKPSTALTIAALVLVAGFVAPGVVADVEESDDGRDENASVGAQVSAFMQASDAGTEGTVESGLFEVAYERSGDRSERRTAVQRRADRLEERLDELDERIDELEARRDDVSELEYRVRMSRLAGELRALERQIERTRPRARQSGADEHRLDGLQGRADELRGSGMRSIVPGLAGGTPPGPPENRSGPPDGRAGAETGEDGDERGPPGPPDGGERGPYGDDDRGATDAAGSSNASGDRVDEGARSNAGNGPGQNETDRDDESDDRRANPGRSAGAGKGDRGPP